MMQPAHTSVAIVGAGPAGCAAALALAAHGIIPTVLERGLPGKDKACGDAFTEDAIDALMGYGLSEAQLLALGGYPYQEVTVAGFGERYPGPTTGWVVRRASIDQWLRDQVTAQVPLRYGTQVMAIAPASPGFALTVRQDGQTEVLTCDAVILATGSANSLSQVWGVAGAPIMGASLSIYVEGDAPSAIEFLFADAYKPGYAWVFPTEAGRANIGVCALSPLGTRGLHARAARFAQDWQLAPDAGWRGGGEAMWSGEGVRWHHPAGLISCGDAGGMIDPLSAEGISLALLSGKTGGTALARFLQAGRAETELIAYSEWVKATCDQRYFALDAGRLLWRIWSGI